LNSRLGPEFDAFLFAPIGEDNNGLPLRIVSLLGRMDLDPWAEASALARLPADAAARKLASLLAGVPVSSLNPPHLSTVATNLIALLPPETQLAGRVTGMLITDSTATPHLAIRAILFAIWLIGLLGLQAIMARHDAPPHSETAQLSAPQISPAVTPSLAASK
jgi:hypothetical protein